MRIYRINTHKVRQSLEQQFDYLFKCAGVKLISCWDLKEHHIIIIKNQKGKFSIEFPQCFICLGQNFTGSFSTVAVAQWVRRWSSDHRVVQAEDSSPGGDTQQTFFSAMMLRSGPNSCCQESLECFDMPLLSLGLFS